MTRSVEERLARALDALQSGALSRGGGRTPRPAGANSEIGELLGTAGYLAENLTLVPAPDSFRRELHDWLVQPRPAPWWRRLMGPLRRGIPDRARRPAVGAAIGLGAAAAVVIGVVAIRRRLASAA